jgi:hypothetical protein
VGAALIIRRFDMGRRAIEISKSEMLEKAKKLNIKNVKKLTNKELMVLVAYEDKEKMKKKILKTMLKKDLRRLASKLGVAVSSKDSKLNMVNKLLNTILIAPSSSQTSSNNFSQFSNDSNIRLKPNNDIDVIIPDRYNIDKIRAYPINPEWAHVYWELSDNTKNEIKHKLSFGGKLVLRLYDVTYIDFNGKNAHRIMQNDISIDSKAWYIKHQNPDADFIAEIGIIYPNNGYESFIRSNVFHSPRNSISDDLSEKWVNPKEIISLRKKGTFNPIDYSYYDKPSYVRKDNYPIIEYMYTESSAENILRVSSSNSISSIDSIKDGIYYE